jgi:hypothetical protein
MRLAPRSVTIFVGPVMFPPGWAKLSTSLRPSESGTTVKCPTFDMPEIAEALQERGIEYTFLFGIAGVPKNNHFWEAGSS